MSLGARLVAVRIAANISRWRSIATAEAPSSPDLTHEWRITKKCAEARRVETSVRRGDSGVTSDSPNRDRIRSGQGPLCLPERTSGGEHDSAQSFEVPWRDANVDMGMEIQRWERSAHDRKALSSDTPRPHRSRAWLAA